MLYNVDDASFVDVGIWMGLVTDDQRLLLLVKELPTRARVLEHRVAKVFKYTLEFSPLQIGRWRLGAESVECLLMLGHGLCTRGRDRNR